MTYDARYDIKATCTSSNHPVPQLRWRQSKIQTQDPVFSWENSKKKKNHISPLWPGATPPPQRLFFSLECGSELFSQPLQRATTGPRSLGSTEGVAPGRRGAYVTQHAQEASRWEKKTHREMTERRKERGQGVCIWKVFSAPRQGPSLCGSDKERKSIAADAKREGAAKPAMSFITIGGSGNMFKAFRPTSKKPFYSQTKSTGRQPTARQGGWKQKFHCNSLFSQVYLCFLSTTWCKFMGTQSEKDKNLCKRLGKPGAGFCSREGRASWQRRSHQCHCKHLPAWPTSNAVTFHQLQPSQSHRANSRNRWRLWGEKGGEVRAGRGGGC